MSASLAPVSLPDDSAAGPVLIGLRLQKRDGSLALFDGERIRSAIEKAFRADLELAADAPTPTDISGRITSMAGAVIRWCAAEAGARDALIQVEEIQDEVERVLMASGEHRVARRYVLYREQHAEKRRARVLHCRRADGSEAELDPAALRAALEEACADLGADVSAAPLLEATLSSLYDGISEAEITQAAIMAARAQIEAEPAYTFVAARLLLGQLFREALGRTVS